MENKSLESSWKWFHKLRESQCCHLWHLLRRETALTVEQEKAVILGGNEKRFQQSYTRTWDRTPTNEAVHATVISDADFRNFNFKWLFWETYWRGSSVTDRATLVYKRRRLNKLRCKMKKCCPRRVNPWDLKRISSVAVASGSQKNALYFFQLRPYGAAVYVLKRS